MHIASKTQRDPNEKKNAHIASNGGLAATPVKKQEHSIKNTEIQ